MDYRFSDVRPGAYRPDAHLADNETDGEIEIRPVFEAGGCAEIPADVREKEERLRTEIARKF